MNIGTDTVPRLEQLDFFSGVCLIQKSVRKPKLHRALTPREKHVLKQVHALNDPLIIEAINCSMRKSTTWYWVERQKKKNIAICVQEFAIRI
jgi:hypothetical protein